jgi:hypothetical protein
MCINVSTMLLHVGKLRSRGACGHAMDAGTRGVALQAVLTAGAHAERALPTLCGR